MIGSGLEGDVCHTLSIEKGRDSRYGLSFHTDLGTLVGSHDSTVPLIVLRIVVGIELGTADVGRRSPLAIVAALAITFVESFCQEHLTRTEMLLADLSICVNSAEGESHRPVIVAVNTSNGLIQAHGAIRVGTVHLSIGPRGVGQAVIAFIRIGVARDVQPTDVGVGLTIYSLNVVNAHV